MIKNTNRNARNICREITELMKGTPGNVREKISAYHEADIALAMERMEREECRRLLEALAPEDIARVLEHAADGASHFRLLERETQAEVISKMETPDAVALLERLDGAERAELLELLPPEVRGRLDTVRAFGDAQIGSHMSANYISIEEGAAVKEAMAQLIRQAAERDNVAVLCVVDKNGRFCGAIDLKDLIVARADTPLADIAARSYPSLYAGDDIESAIPVFRDYAEASIPALDEDGRLIGVAAAPDFMDIIGDELGEDYAKLAGLTSGECASEPVLRSVRKRLPWLCVLLALGMGVSAAVGMFENIVAQLPVIMCFQSLILDMAGNVGTQSLAVAIRMLMDTELARRQRLSLVSREMRVGLLNGVVLGVLSFVAIGAYLCVKGSAAGFAFAVSGCLGAAMVLAMLVSALSGTVIPLFFERIGIDPAVASGPLITTVNDLVAVISYYGLAWLILIRTLRFA